MPYRFLPPRENAAVITFVNTFFPLFLPLHDDVARVTVAEEDWQHLAALRSHRALLLPNHPSQTEPVIMGWLARKMGQPFNYVATHEMFVGLDGWICNRLGAFTIRRGWPDRTSIWTAVQRLAEYDRKLVIFPEGETHMQNDTIIPFHEGALQIGFWTLDRLRQLKKPPQLPVVPVAIRYRCLGDPVPALRRGLERLETQFGMKSGSGRTYSDRLLAAGLVVLDGIEREYGIASNRRSTPEAVNDRIRRLYRHITGRVAHVMHAVAPEDEPVHLGMRTMFNVAFDFVDMLANENTPYERRLHERRLAAAKSCLDDLWRVQNFMVISEEAFQPPLSAERAGEILWRLEKEVYGKGRTRPMREAAVRIGEPVDLSMWSDEYRSDRRGTVAACTKHFEESLRTLLTGIPPSGCEV